MSKFFVLTAGCLLAGVSVGAVSDFVRTEAQVAAGVTRISWTREGDSPARAWAMKFDLGACACHVSAQCDGESKHAVDGFAARAAAAGQTPVCGINADYFHASRTEPDTSGLCISEGALAMTGYSYTDTKLTAQATSYAYDRNASRYFVQTDDGTLAIGYVDRYAVFSGFPKSADEFHFGGKRIWNAVRVNTLPVVDGARGEPDGRSDSATYPRSIVGIGRDLVVFFVSDGRQEGWSVGVSDDDAAALLIAEGVTEAGEMDGGGSASLWCADVGDGGYVNRPCDGSPREVANSLMMMSGAWTPPVRTGEMTVVTAGSVSFTSLYLDHESTTTESFDMDSFPPGLLLLLR